MNQIVERNVAHVRGAAPDNALHYLKRMNITQVPDVAGEEIEMLVDRMLMQQMIDVHTAAHLLDAPFKVLQYDVDVLRDR